MLFAALAQAAVPTFVWDPAQTYRYHLESRFLYSSAVTFYAGENHEAKATDFRIVADLECKAAKEGKNTALNCGFAWLGFAAQGNSGSQERLDAICAEYVDFMKPGTIELLLGPDGRIKEADIDGVARSSARVRNITEGLRNYLLRSVALLHLPLPSDPKDLLRGYRDPNPTMLVALPTATGTVGSVELTHREDGESYGLVEVASEAVGTVAKGGSVDASAAYLLDVRGAGTGLYDGSTGQLVYRGFQFDTRTMASAERNGTDAYLYYAAAIQRVEAFGPDGQAPPSILAERQPRIAKTPAEVEGLPLVPFSELGMNTLYMLMPESARALQLPRTVVKARVQVASDGLVRGLEVFDGYEVLAETVERALRASRFTPRGEGYVVDVDVEMRPE